MITGIRLQNFRSYQDSSFEFEKNNTIIVGPNACGKTNLLEAFYLVCTARSFRPVDQNNIRFESDWARVDATTDDNQTRTIKIKNNGQSTTRTLEIDGDEIKRKQPKQLIPVVLFEPNQLYQIATSPDMRRSTIDGIIEQVNPEYSAHIKKYKRALFQRNTLLKKKPNDIDSQLFAWNIRLSDLGGYIYSQRIKIINDINQNIGNNYSSIAGKSHVVKLDYVTKIKQDNYSSDYLKQLEGSYQLDLLRGFTSLGPHRDDVMIKINSNDLRSFVSRGEARTTLLALKKCEAEILENYSMTKPVFLLDDVFSELDGRRRSLLTNFLKYHQTLITTTDADIIEKSFAQKTQLIKLK